MSSDHAKSHQQPLWAQVATALRHDLDRLYAPGDTLPTASDLKQRFGVSRITIRRTISEFVAEGLVTRR